MRVMTKCYFNNIDYCIKNYLSNARSSVYIVVAWINTTLFEAEFNWLVQKNIQITILYNDDFINAKIIKKQDGIQYVPVKMPNKKNKMHNKFCVIDSRIVISGSYNWSRSANDNFENVIVTDEKIVVAKFLNEFYELSNVNSLYEYARDTLKCKKCGHKMFRLGVIQSEDEVNCVDCVDIFNVCTFDTEHSKFMKSVYYHGLNNFLNQPDFFYDDEYTDEREAEENKILNHLSENHRMYELMSFFNCNNEWNIHFHALAYKTCDNYSRFIEGYDAFEHWVYNTVWKNKFLANCIEDEYECLDTY